VIITQKNMPKKVGMQMTQNMQQVLPFNFFRAFYNAALNRADFQYQYIRKFQVKLLFANERASGFW